MKIGGLTGRISTGRSEHATALGQVLDKFEEELETENKNKQELLAIIRTIRTWIGEDIRLDPVSLGDTFRGAKEAYLDQSCNLVIIDANGRTTRRPLEGLPAQLFLVVAWETTPNLLKLVASKAESVVISKKPLLAASIAMDSNNFHLTKEATPRLSVSNSGGDASDLRLALRAREGSGSSAPIVSLGPVGLARNAKREFYLGSLKNCTGAHISLELACKDEDGRGYEWLGEIEVRNGQSFVISLAPSGQR